MKLRTRFCPVCGRQFEAGGSVKYCSAECRDEAAKRSRQAWEQRSGYKEKRRIQMREYRARRAAEKEPAALERRAARAKVHENAAADQRRKLQERAEAGDPHARMRLSNPLSVEYWQAFQEYELSLDADSGRTVNGISVLEPSFPEDVLESIERTGSISRAMWMPKRR